MTPDQAQAERIAVTFKCPYKTCNYPRCRNEDFDKHPSCSNAEWNAVQAVAARVDATPERAAPVPTGGERP